MTKAVSFVLISFPNFRDDTFSTANCFMSAVIAQVKIVVKVDGFLNITFSIIISNQIILIKIIFRFSISDINLLIKTKMKRNFGFPIPT